MTMIEDVAFDDAATLMGKAFDHACKSLRNFGPACTVREIIAKRIINGRQEMASAIPPASMSKH
jgi:hypothetical protein